MNTQGLIFQDIRVSLPLLLFLSVDFVFIVLHVINGISPLPNSFLFNITKDHGYAEMYQYIKFFWVIILFAYILKATKSYCYAAWILVFTYFLLDDSLRIHELFGRYIATRFNFTPPLDFRPQDFGELTASVIAGTFLSTIVAWSYLHGSHTFKKITIDLLIFVMALAFFGVFVDIAKHAFQIGRIVSFGLGIIEDGGEMVVVSLILWYVALLAIRNGVSDLFLHDFTCKPLTSHYS
ncbi:MAG: hypothetical protein H8E62_00490 [Planctomycetes bacterium]|nr:hypothetical protein [Planctomycetota bacterium]